MAGQLDTASTPGRNGISRAAALAPRLVHLVVAVVFAGFVLNALQHVIAQRPTFGHVAPAAVCLAVMMALQLGLFSNPRTDVRGRYGYLALLVQAVLVLVPLAFYGTAWTGMQGFLAGDALLVLRPLAGWLVFGVLAVGNGLVQYQISEWAGSSLLDAVYVANVTAGIGLVVYGLSRLRSLVQELDDTRSDLAALAVARERLRFARDLHDLLGFSLSAITLKTELAYRLITGRPEQARQELAEIHDIARRALADVRALASSYGELSLDDEMASARSVLTAADIAVTVRYERNDLPPAIRTVLATVLREGVTNLLRHSKAESCDITVAGDGRTVSITIVNDGVGGGVGTDDRPTGNGIGNLRSRAEALGGTLTAAPGPDRTYRLHATIPLRIESAQRDDAPTDPAADAAREPRDRGPAIAPRTGRAIATAVFAGYAVTATVFVIGADVGVGGTLVAEAAILLSLGLMLGFFSRPSVRLRSPLGYALLAAQAVATYLPIILFQNAHLGLPGLLAGSLLLALPARIAISLFLVVATSNAGTYFLLDGDSIAVTYGFLVTINHGLVVFAVSRLRSTVQDLHDARSELADLAVTRERLRFARDLHALLGVALSAITLKSALSHRLVNRDPARAQQELSAILGTSRQALADVRAAAASYREQSREEPAAVG